MPGLAGIISRKQPGECESFVKAMVSSMKHEDFYASGLYAVPEMGVHAGWVALDGSLAAGQVFFNEQRDVALLLSGECFFPPQTRAELSGRGHELSPNQASWLLHLYEDDGEQFLGKLNGLFSGLIIDKRQRKVFLFNDRYGAERIYWHETKDAVYFASEAKALLRILPELRSFDKEGVAQFLTFGSTLEWRTLFKDVHVVPGASVWCFEDGICRKRKYFSPETWETESALSIESFESEFQEILSRVLPRYFESESKIGISLTGGLDSRMIMACRPKGGPAPVCYTFAGENGQTLDARLAARVAEACGFDYSLLRIGPDFFSEFATLADRTVYITDGCFGILGAHEIYLNRKARHLAMVRMTGNYGSEVLRGMCTFKPLGLSSGLINPEFGQTPGSSAHQLTNGEAHPVTFAAFKEIPWNLFGSLAAGRSQLTTRTPYLDNEIVALAYRAPESLRTSSAPALRLIKNTDPVLANIPTDMGQMGEAGGMSSALSRLFSKVTFKLDYINNEGLPHWLSPFDPLFARFDSGEGLLGLHKFLHYRSWFRRQLGDYLEEILRDAQTRRSPLWNSAFLDEMVTEHRGGRKNYVLEINAVLTLEAVERLFFRDFPQGGSDLNNSRREDRESLLTT